MRIVRFIITSLTLSVIALVWNGFLHTIILPDFNEAVSLLRRPDLANFMWLSLLMILGITSLYVLGYSQFARKGTLQEGISYGLFFAILAGLLVDLNQYILYPIPASTALAWFGGGVVEFVLYGILITKLYPIE
jgi:hypothetical protein